MQIKRLLTPGTGVHGRSQGVTLKRAWRSIRCAAVVLALAAIAGQFASAQAQTTPADSVSVDAPRTTFCPHQKTTFTVHVVNNAAVNPDEPPEYAYERVTTDASVEADVADASVGKINGANPITRYSPSPELARVDTWEFAFEALKEGTTTITFRAKLNGTDAASQDVQVTVKACSFIIGATSTWTVPGPNGGTWTLEGFVERPAKVKIQPDGTFSGTGSVVWNATVKGTPCGFPYTLQRSQVKVTGSMNNDGDLDVTMTYTPVTEKEIADCLMYTNKANHTMSVETMKFTTAYPEQPKSENFSQAITAPMEVPGKATVFISPDTSGK